MFDFDANATYLSIVVIFSLPAAIVGFIFLRKYLGLRAFQFEKRSLKWFVEGLVMQRNILLPIIKDIALNIVGIFYLWITLFYIFGSFGAGSMWAVFFFIYPVVFRAFYEIFVFVLPMLINTIICFGMFLTNRIRYYTEENNKYIAKSNSENL